MSLLRRILIAKAMNQPIIIDTFDDFNFTAYDSNGAFEGMSVYNGTPVAYALGKPVINGNSVSFSINNGFSIENTTWFQSGTLYQSENPIPAHLVIPKTYQGLPVKKILPYAIYGASSKASNSTFYLPYIIESIDFGQVSELCVRAVVNCAKMNMDSNSYTVPDSIKGFAPYAMFGTPAYSSIWYEFDTSSNTVIERSKPILNKFIFGTNLDSVGALEDSATNSIPYGVYKLPQIHVGNVRPLSSDTHNGTSWTGTYSPTPGVFGSTNYAIIRKTCTQISGDLFYRNGNTFYPNKLVFEHTDSDQITLNLSSNKTSTALTIYTDSTYIKNYDWSGHNFNVTFKTLSDYISSNGGEGLYD